MVLVGLLFRVELVVYYVFLGGVICINCWFWSFVVVGGVFGCSGFELRVIVLRSFFKVEEVRG